MNFFKRKKKSKKDRIEKAIEILKSVGQENADVNDFGFLFSYIHKGEGATLASGTPFYIHKMLKNAAQQSEDFAKVIHNLSAELSGKSMNATGTHNPLDALPKSLRNQIEDMEKTGKKSSLVDLPGGGKGLVVDHSNLDKLSDSDVDNIIDNLLSGIDEQRKKDEEDG